MGNAPYRMGDGLAYIYTVLDDKSAGGKPIKPLQLYGKAYFDYLSIGSDDFQIALQEGAKIEMRIRILQNREVGSLHVVRVSGQYYSVWRTRHTVNKHGVPVTDLTLERTTVKYDLN